MIGLLQGVTTFVIVGCIQMKILKKAARVGVFNSQLIQNTEATTDKCSMNLVKIIKKSFEGVHFQLNFARRSTYLVENKLLDICFQSF